MRALGLFLFLSLAIFCSTTFCADLGTFTYDSDELVLSSPDIEMQVVFEVTSSVAMPTFSVETEGVGEDYSLEQVTSVDGTHIEFSIPVLSYSTSSSSSSSGDQFFTSSGSSSSSGSSFSDSESQSSFSDSDSTSGSTRIGFGTIPSLLALVLFMFNGNNRLSVPLLLFVCVLCLGFSTAQESESPLFKITIRVPENYEWENIILEGKITSAECTSSLKVKNLVMNLCGSNIDEYGDIVLKNIEISNFVELCGNSIDLEGAFAMSVEGTITSTTQLHLTMTNEYQGKLELLYNTILGLEGDSCSFSDESIETSGLRSVSVDCQDPYWTNGLEVGVISLITDQIELLIIPKPSASGTPKPLETSIVFESKSSSQTPKPQESVVQGESKSNTATPTSSRDSEPSETPIIGESESRTPVPIGESQSRTPEPSSTPTSQVSVTPSRSVIIGESESSTPIPVGESQSTTPVQTSEPSRSPTSSPIVGESESSTPIPVGESQSTTPVQTSEPSRSPTSSPIVGESESSTPIPVEPTATPSRSNIAQPSSSPTSGLGCTRSDSLAVDIVPFSEPVSSTWLIPGEESSYTEMSQWSTSYWNNDNNILPVFSQSDASTVQISERQYGLANMYFYTVDGETDIISGSDYTIEFDFYESPDNAYDPDLDGVFQHNITFWVIDDINEDNLGYWYTYIPDGSCNVDACNVLHQQTIFSEFTFPQSEGDAVTISNSFNVQFNGPVQLIFLMELSGRPWGSNGNDYFIKDFTLNLAEKERSLSPVISLKSEFVDLPSAPTVSQPTQTDCPHLRDDLVDWHDPSIWGGSIPEANGADIVIPDGTSVLISPCSIDSDGTYGTIFVNEGTELIFADADISIKVQNIFVNGGHLWIGSETCRYNSNIEITLMTSGVDVSSFGTKGIVSAGDGIIDMHGKLYQSTWSRLAADTSVGDDRIMVMDDINWEVGQEIVIVTSIWKDHEDPQNEVFTIIAIEGRRIQIDGVLQYQHYAGEEYQSEVGLLSRRILIQGDEESENTNVGGHIMVTGAIGRFSGVQTYRMGQTNVLGRYPFHFHMMGNSPESYFQDCSVYHSYYRCYTVHGTNSTRLSRNVAYDVQGHCYYLEDGVEEHNIFEYNMAAYVQPIVEIDFYANGYGQDGVTIYQSDDLLIPADAAPAGFYISNANNDFYGNTASGGFAGYSFINFGSPIGNHRDWTFFVPEERPLFRFEGNTAHSASYQWLRAACIYIGGDQWYDGDTLVYNVGRNSRNTKDDNGDSVFMHFDNNVVYLCNRGLNHWGNRAEVVGYAAHDVIKGITTFGESFIADAVIEGVTQNTLIDRPTVITAFQFYDIFVQTILDNILIKNIGVDNDADTPDYLRSYGFSSLTHSDKFKPQGINAVRGITYENVFLINGNTDYIEKTGASRYYNVMDWDGSFLGTGEPTLIGSANDELYSFDDSDPDAMRIKEWWRVREDCVLQEEYTLYACPNANMDLTIGHIYVDINQVTNYPVSAWPWNDWTQDNGIYVGTVSQFGFSGEDRRSTIVTANPGVTGITGDIGWYFNFDNGTPQEFFIRTNQLPIINGEFTYLIIAMVFPRDDNINFRITTTHVYNSQVNGDVTEAASFSDLYNDSEGRQYYLHPINDDYQWLFIKAVDMNNEYLSDGQGVFERRGISIYDVNQSYYYRVATCTTLVNDDCPTYEQTEPLYWSVDDFVPPTVESLLQ